MKPLKLAKKSLLVGSLAAAILLGGTIPGFGGEAAYASETTGVVNYEKIVETHLASIIVDVASLADQQDSAIRDSLRQGKSLVEASGMKGDDLLDTLITSMNQSIDFAARDDKSVKSEELKRLKADAAGKISSILLTKGYEDKIVIEVDYKKVVEKEVSSIIGGVALYANKTDDAIRKVLEQGGTLVEASGLKSDELYDKLVNSMNQSIDFAAQNDKSITADQLNRMKSEAAAKISTALSTKGYGSTKEVKVDYDKVVETELSTIIGGVALYANKTDTAIRDALQQGKTLTEASGLERGELYGKLVDSMNQSIDFAARNDKSITADQLNRMKSEAAAKISTALSKSGYGK
ncbi:hypothetical protein [Paenibacillus ginsengarvi]|uniref:Uncharacterized protein n=1 Tax=Paenibacillus ginsengarvi TaxID=400777 RepID=A0A3B0BR78_9BACL|nr:hypothetical protein [Paenibacillus ginsengarvi]RKN74206.1 hypothetical protein D7M11_27550 [Paenibacillus ginsengarvi]